MWEHRFGSTYSALNQKSDEAFFQNINCIVLICMLPHIKRRLDRGARWEVRQRNIQTEKDEQEEHWGRAQSASIDINKQWRVRATDSMAATHLIVIWGCQSSRGFLCVYDRLALESDETDLDVQLHCSSSLEAEPEKVVLRAESPPLASAFALPTSFEEDVLDLKWRQSIRALL